MKFLGVLLDSNLSWKSHLTELSKKLARTAGLFYEIRHYASMDTLILLYYGLFESFLSMVYLCGAQLILCILIQYSFYRREYWKLLPSIRWLYHLLHFLIVCKFLNWVIYLNYRLPPLFYECLNSLAPIYFREYFTSIQSIHSIGTRQSKKGDLYALRCNTTQYGLRSIHYSGVRIWNSLPVEIRNSQSLPNFKKKMKAYIFSFYKFKTKI